MLQKDFDMENLPYEEAVKKLEREHRKRICWVFTIVLTIILLSVYL